MPGVILVQKANSNLNDRGITFFAELVVEVGGGFVNASCFILNHEAYLNNMFVCLKPVL